MDVAYNNFTHHNQVSISTSAIPTPATAMELTNGQFFIFNF